MDGHTVSLERAVTVLVETVETAKSDAGTVWLHGTADGAEVLASLRVVLNEMRDQSEICVAALKSKILVDHMFLEALLNGQDVKPTTEGKVRDHLAWTRRNFETCFAKDLDSAMAKLREVLGEVS